MVTVFAPLISKEYLIPMIMHPRRWGGIPFKPPSSLKYALLYMICNFIIIGLAAVLSGMMTTLRECDKVDVIASIKNTQWVILSAFIGMLILMFIPFIKAPVIAVLSWMPYANHIVTGLYLSVIVMIGGMYANTFNRRMVCNSP